MPDAVHEQNVRALDESPGRVQVMRFQHARGGEEHMRVSPLKVAFPGCIFEVQMERRRLMGSMIYKLKKVHSLF